MVCEPGTVISVLFSVDPDHSSYSDCLLWPLSSTDLTFGDNYLLSGSLLTS